MDEKTPCNLKGWSNMLFIVFHAILIQISNYYFCAIFSDFSELGPFSNSPSEPTFALVLKVLHRQVWGLAYEISDEDWEGGVRDQLDHREKGGYSQHRARSYWDLDTFNVCLMKLESEFFPKCCVLVD